MIQMNRFQKVEEDKDNAIEHLYTYGFRCLSVIVMELCLLFIWQQ